MRRQRILCDVDGVLGDFLAPALDIIHSITGRRYNADEFHEWDLFETVGRIHEPAFYEAWKVPGTCLSIPVIPGSHEGIKGLLEYGDLYIVTAPMGRVATWSHERDTWLKNHFGIPHKNIVHTSAKYVVSGDYLIDDKPTNLQTWLEHHPLGVGILWDQPYNQKVNCGPRIHRARNWKEVFAILDDPPDDGDVYGPMKGTSQYDTFMDEAKRQGIPGPDVTEHPEGYDGPCLCYECIPRS